MSQTFHSAPKFTEHLLSARLCARGGAYRGEREACNLMGETHQNRDARRSERGQCESGGSTGETRGIRAGFLEEVMSDSHLKEGIGEGSQVKEDEEGI